MQFLWGLTGQMKAVKDYLTTNLSTGRAAKIDFLDAAVTSRAAASTAVSTADYTSVRAGKLDNLDAVVSGRLGSIKAIYSGEVLINNGSYTGTATITAVNLSRAILIFNGSRIDYGAGSDTFAHAMATIALTATTTITATRNSNGQALRVGYMVVEFNA